MRVYRINATTNSLAPKRKIGQKLSSLGEKVKCKLSPKYAEKVMVKNMQEVDSLYLKANPELEGKRAAVYKFMQDIDFAAPKIDTNEKANFNYLMKETPEDVINCLGDNVSAIYNELGAYGLKVYSKATDYENILKMPEDYQINEQYMISDKKISSTFNEYLSSNKNGYVNDIYKRFGQYGKYLMDEYSTIGLVKNGLSSECKETYSITKMFNETVEDFIPIEDLCYLMGITEI